MKFFSMMTKSLRPQAKLNSEDERAGWIRDPLSHPELESMSIRELADLPFNRGCQRPAEAWPCCG